MMLSVVVLTAGQFVQSAAAAFAMPNGATGFGFDSNLWDAGCDLDRSPRWGDHAWAAGYWSYAWRHAGEDRTYNFNDDRARWDSAFASTYRNDQPGGVGFVMTDGSVQFLRN